jgi:hypothetical protein
MSRYSAALIGYAASRLLADTPLHLPENPAFIDIMFECLVTAWRLHSLKLQRCEATARMPALYGTSQSSSNRIGVPAGHARQVTWSSADNSRKPGLGVIGSVTVRKWCSNRHSVPEGVRSYRVTLDRAGRWHIAFAAIPKPIPPPGTGKVVGIDRGVSISAALSTGEILAATGLKKPLRIWLGGSTLSASKTCRSWG